MLLIILLYVIFWIFFCDIKLRYFMHMLQIEGYKNHNYIEWLKEYKSKVYTKYDKFYLVINIVFALGIFLLNSFTSLHYLIVGSIFLATTIIFLIISKSKKYEAKKPLVFTQRAKRLYMMILAVLLLGLVITFVILYFIVGNNVNNIALIALILTLMYYFSAYYIYIGNYFVSPIEKKINQSFYNLAYNKIRNMKNITSVGITGSYGKTSTKFLTSTILKEKFNVLTTPDSYNTPMGLSKVINNDLNDEHEIFVAELGATKLGDIEEVANLTNPKIGIITSIGPCHLESFKSIENIMRTKYELIDALPDDGTAIFNYDNDYVKKLADKTFKEKILYGIDNIEQTDVFATNIKVSDKGSVFTLCLGKLGVIECTTKLLGKHNILNILAGASAAMVLGLSLEQIAEGISKIEAVEHRLQLIDPGTGVLVIDDAFNSNPDGARAALEVLDSFKDKRKIIVTPGMVELGEIEEEENRKFGEHIAKICDIAILVGKNRTLPIYKGIVDANFNVNNLYVVSSLEEATKTLGNITRVNDVVLFENDLPDTYNEK